MSVVPLKFRNLIKRVRSDGDVQQVQSFATFAAAQAACRNGGYGAGQIEEVVYQKTVRLREACWGAEMSAMGGNNWPVLLPVCLAYQRQQRPLTVLDFGGACGAHYFIARALLHDDIALRWNVVETPNMAARAKSLESDEVRFFASIQEARAAAGDIDLIYTSGALQYVPNPYATLQELVDCEAGFLALVRFAATTAERDVIGTHPSRLLDHGPGTAPNGGANPTVKTAFVFPVKRRVDAILREHYSVIVQTADNSGVFPVGDEPLVGLTLVAERTC